MRGQYQQSSALQSNTWQRCDQCAVACTQTETATPVGSRWCATRDAVRRLRGPSASSTAECLRWACHVVQRDSSHREGATCCSCCRTSRCRHKRYCTADGFHGTTYTCQCYRQPRPRFCTRTPPPVGWQCLLLARRPVQCPRRPSCYGQPGASESRRARGAEAAACR